MPVIKQNFELKYEDIERLNKALINFQGSSEQAINNCLEKKAGPKIAKSVTDFLPVSKDGNRHAKNNKWYELEYYNLSFVLSNSLKGKRGTSFYYLYYPATGTGNSYRKGPNDFLGKGLNTKYNEVIEDLLSSLENQIEEDFNNE